MKEKILPGKFYRGSAVKVAQKLLGMYLASYSPEGVTVGRIVETESYLGINDPASHSFKGPTKRNAPMFGRPGHAYVYFTYGMHYCFNVVTGQEGVGEAVLIRALEPLTGIELMKRRRGIEDSPRLCNGPAKLTQALGINLQSNGTDLTEGPIKILAGTRKGLKIITSTRIGISRARELPLRFFLQDNRFVSGNS